jgi:hypothetical protein
MEWVVTHRHLETGRSYVDDRGNLTGPVTDELPIRAFWRRWTELMTSETKLVAR